MMIRLLIMTLVLLPPLPALAMLHYQGETSLYEDTIWEGEVLVDGILTVAMGATLEIRPGTVVRFTRTDSNADGIGENELFVQGRLLARGTESQPILFSSAQASPRPGDWGAINMMMSEEEGNLFEHCVVEYAYRGFHAHFSRATLRNSSFRNNQRAAQFQESTVAVEGCVFADNFNGLQFRDSTVSLTNCRVLRNNWGIRAVMVDLTLSDSTVRDNRVNGISLRDSDFLFAGLTVAGNRRGVYLQRSRGALLNTRLLGNREHGIYLEDSIVDLHDNRIEDNGRSGLKVQNSGGNISGNAIIGNHQYALVNDGQMAYLVGPNWYGAQSPRMLDGRQRPGYGMIELAAPLSAAP